jgi:GT2 family glycosyltransferase
VPKNISYARNLGAKQGNAELILFIDDDVVVGRNHFFELIIARMRNLDFSCGARRYWTRTDWSSYLEKTYSITHIQNILHYKTYLPKSVERITGNPSFHEFSFIGHFGAIKRSVFEKVNGFDELFKEWSYQDTDLMMRLCADGFQYGLLHYDEISVYHLSHGVDKFAFQEINKNLFLEKQAQLGINFRLNHFFGIFDDDSYSILS